jgi:hypothetical protein
MKVKLILNKCEIDGCEITECLHKHHIIERTDINTSNDNSNIAILCPNHHNFVHKGLLRIIGIYPSTKMPNCRTLIYELGGIKNLDIESEYLPFKNKVYKI